MGEKIVVGISGGVDSAVCAYLLKQQGYEVIGVTMQTWREQGIASCVEDGRTAAEALGIEHHVVDFSGIFREKVVDYFMDEYACGRTPNPCVVCNRYVKWQALLDYAKTCGAERIATGHYARIERMKANGRLAVKNSACAEKDQTYVLYGLSQDQLARTRMPLGEYTKEQVRQIAADAKLVTVASKAESMENCFIEDNDYAGFIDRMRPQQAESLKGNFVRADGSVIGPHKGITHYTMGQRRGLGIAAGERIFVTGIDPVSREVRLGANEELMTQSVSAGQLCYMGAGSFEPGMEVLARIRYNHRGNRAVVQESPEGILTVRFEEPVRAATPGQSLVLYQDGCVLGGGIIL